MSNYLVSESRIITASPQRCFDIVADPAMHPAMDGSGTVRAPRPGSPQRLSLGARFAVEMKLGVPYRMTNEVIEFDEPHQIAWRHVGGHVWRYLFEAVEDGTRVTEQWDARPAAARSALVLLGYSTRNRRAIRASLQLLSELASPSPAPHAPHPPQPPRSLGITDVSGGTAG